MSSSRNRVSELLPSLLLLGVLHGCVDVPSDAIYACDAAGQCPDGFQCIEGLCQPAGPSCMAVTCSSVGANCGTLPDGCGGTLACGTCASSELCGAGGVENVCASAPCVKENDASFCARMGKNCGSLNGVDKCGDSRTANCGACSGGLTCGGAGVDNVCAPCMAKEDGALCAHFGAQCGPFTTKDNCGDVRTLNCGACLAPLTCGANGRENECG